MERASLAIAATLSIVLAGCSSFERDWAAAAPVPASASPSPDSILEGRWEGTWRSEANGHSGGLRAIIARDDQGVLVSRYKATYGCCFTFQYSVPMTVAREGEAARFQGSADLGWLAGGLYHYDGKATASEFTSTYKSSGDHGLFEMKRPGK